MNVNTLDKSEGASVRVFQWKYTSCAYNVEKINGFATFSKSSELSDVDVDDLRKALGRYVAPENAPPRPTVEELRDRNQFPVAFSSLKLKSGRSVIARTCAVGKDYGGARYGNFFVHALILENGEFFDPLRYFDSPTFAKGLTQEEINLGQVPDPLPTLDLKDVVPNSRFFQTRFADLNEKAAQFRRALVDCVLKSFRDGKRTIVVGYLDSAQKLIAWTFASIPAPFASRIEFTTYSGAPLDETRQNEKNDVVLMFTNREREQTLARRDDDLIVRLSKRLESKYAEALSDEFLAFIDRFDFSFAANLSKSELFDVLEGVATLFLVLRGRTEPKDFDVCHKFLTSQTATVCASLACDFDSASEDARSCFWNGWLELTKREREILYETFLNLSFDETYTVGEQAIAFSAKVRTELWDFLRQFVDAVANKIVASFDKIDVEKLARFWRFFNSCDAIHAEFQDFLKQTSRNVVENFYSRIFEYENFTSKEVKTLLVDCVDIMNDGQINGFNLDDAHYSTLRTDRFQEKIAAFWIRNLQDDAPALWRRELLLNDFADVFGAFDANLRVSQAKTFLQLFRNFESSTKVRRLVETLELYVEFFDGVSLKDALVAFDKRFSLMEDGRRFLFEQIQCNGHRKNN